MIGFNGGLLGKPNDATAFPSKPGIWTPLEQVSEASQGIWALLWLTTWTNTSVDTASSGIIPNGGDPYWIDIVPTNADLNYDSASFAAVHDGTLTTSAYWTGVDYTAGNVTRARLDLRNLSVNSLRIYASDLGLTPYSVQLLDASKAAISGTSRTLDSNTAAWHVMTVLGSPRYLEFSCTTGGSRRLRLYAIEVNGKILTNA